MAVNHYIVDKVLVKIREIIGIDKFNDTEILIDTDDKLPNDFTLKNAVILTTCVIKDNGKFYSQLFLEEALFFKQGCEKKEIELFLIDEKKYKVYDIFSTKINTITKWFCGLTDKKSN